MTDPKSNPLRDAANVIADAVEKAKDDKIEQAEEKLRDAQKLLKQGRKELIAVLKDAQQTAEAIAVVCDEKSKEQRP